MHFPSSSRLALRRTVEEDLDFVVAAETHAENRPYVFQWPRDRHRAALANGDLRHLILDALPEKRPVGYAILAGIHDAHRSVELMRIVVTAKRQGYGREGVRLIQDRETRLTALDASIARGLADADAGRTAPAESVFDRLETKYRAMGE